jgi:hypothetical protein
MQPFKHPVGTSVQLQVMDVCLSFSMYLGLGVICGNVSLHSDCCHCSLCYAYV